MTWHELFTVGSQCGLNPNELLDLNLDTVSAVIEGYKARMLDQEILIIQGGFFAGYYSKAKKPKPLKSIINKIVQQAAKIKQKQQGRITAPDVAKFQRLEELFAERGVEIKRG